MSIKHLLTSVIDYAGLFPPAQLSLPDAIAHCDRAYHSPYPWLIDRFVIPAARLPELVQSLPELIKAPPITPWRLSVILSDPLGTDVKALYRMVDALSAPPLMQISALEVAPVSPAQIQQIRAQCPDHIPIVFEISWESELDPYLQELQATGSAAKLRTGGVTAEAFPTCAQLAQRVLDLAQARVPFKATAGLHHPLRGSYRLTYQPDSATTIMHGFLNVSMLAGLAYQQSISLTDAVDLLEEGAIAAFHFTDTAIQWRHYTLSLPDIEQLRHHFFLSIGSCSFQEPIDDLHSLGLL